MPTLRQLAGQLARGEVRSRDLVAQCLERVADPDGEGERVFIEIDEQDVLAQAENLDSLRQAGSPPSEFAGIPISVKDLFDVQGQVTRAGSRILDASPVAAQDAEIVRRLRQAGFVIFGRTNMTEFAYSGLGLNPHYGTPANPHDRMSRRIPGGSSSGAAVSVTDGMAFGAIGTDTGGSCRIPAAFCGITGYKPTAHRVPLKGVYPLSESLDSVGPLAQTVECCAILDAVMSGEERELEDGRPASSLKLGILTNYVLENMEPVVAGQYQLACTALSEAGIELVEFRIEDLESLPELNAKGGLAAAEAYAWHQDMLGSADAERYDPRVSSRIVKGSEQSAADYLHLLWKRREIISTANEKTAEFDAVIYPTVPIIAPLLSDFEGNDDVYAKLNLLALRNPTVTNFLDRCGISLPIRLQEAPPVGLMVMGEHGKDRELFQIARTLETLVSGKE